MTGHDAYPHCVHCEPDCTAVHHDPCTHCWLIHYLDARSRDMPGLHPGRADG